MKRFQDLYIYLNSYDIEQLMIRFTEKCINNWSRDFEREKKLNSLGEKKAYCYEHLPGDGLEGAFLTLFHKENNTWYVSNIIPIQKGELSFDEYNKVLADFLEKIVEPVIKDIEVTADLTKDQIFIEDIIGNDLNALLKKFSALANKSTGSSHPLDRKRWFNFILAVNEKELDLDIDILIRTLIEQGWTAEGAQQLAIEYEFAEELLNYQKGK